MIGTTEDRARAAMRAIAGTVQQAPPLELRQARDLVPLRERRRARDRGPGWGHRRRSLLAPVAAAITIVAVAVALAVIRNIPNDGVATPSAGSSATSGANAGEAPEYYVARVQSGTPYLVVGDTFTGRAIATVTAPAGVLLEAVYGAAADDRTFVVAGNRPHGADAGTVWYLLRIAPGSSTPAGLTPLPVPVRQGFAGAALSPDGTEVAVALPGSPATVRVYAAATGALRRQWSTTAPGELTAEKAPAGGSRPFTAVVLRWSADGRQLAFAWNASAFRVLDAAAPDGDLIASSAPLAAIGTTYATESSYTCHAAQGWQPITIATGAEAGQGVVCGASAQTGRYTPCTSPTDMKCAYTQLNSIGFLRATQDGRGGSFKGIDAGSDCPDQAKPGNGAYIGWANADGSEVIGFEACAGHTRFGIFRAGKFTPLPALPVSVPGALEGTTAW